MKKEDYFSKIKITSPGHEKKERTKQIIKLFDIKNNEEKTKLYLKSDVILFTCVFEKFVKVSIKEYHIKPLFCVSLPGYTWQCGMKYTFIRLQILEDKGMFLLSENFRGGISPVMSDRYVKSDDNVNFLYIDATNL